MVVSVVVIYLEVSEGPLTFNLISSVTFQHRHLLVALLAAQIHHNSPDSSMQRLKVISHLLTSLVLFFFLPSTGTKTEASICRLGNRPQRVQFRNSLHPLCENTHVITTNKKWKQKQGTLLILHGFICMFLCFCSFCDAIHETVNVYHAAADHHEDDSNSKMNIFLYIPFNCPFDFPCSEHMKLCTKSVKREEAFKERRAFSLWNETRKKDRHWQIKERKRKAWEKQKKDIRTILLMNHRSPQYTRNTSEDFSTCLSSVSIFY